MLLQFPLFLSYKRLLPCNMLRVKGHELLRDAKISFYTPFYSGIFCLYSQSLDPYVSSDRVFEFHVTFLQKRHFYLSFQGTCENMRYVATPSLCASARYLTSDSPVCGGWPWVFLTCPPASPLCSCRTFRPTVSLTWCALLLFFSAW